MNRMLKFLSQLVTQLMVFLLFFAMLGSIAVAARNSVASVAGFWWVAGLIVGLVWLVGVFALCFVVWYAMRPSAPKWLRTYILVPKASGSGAGLAEQYPEATLSALMCVAILTAIAVLTGVSEVLASRGLFTYAIEGAFKQPMRERLFSLYVWHAIDMIPLIDVWDIYGIEPPLRLANFWAQSAILVFRSAVVGFAASVIAQWLNFYRDRPLRGDRVQSPKARPTLAG
jgi:hypothetical protein